MPTDTLDKSRLEAKRNLLRKTLGSREGLQALRDITGYNFVLAGEAKEEKLPIVSMLSPSRSGFKPESNQSILKMINACHGKCVVAPEPAIGTSIVHWSRNDLFIRHYDANLPCDEFLLIDDDMDPEPEALVRLLEHRKNGIKGIIAAGCTLRSDPPKPNFRTFDRRNFAYRTAFEWKTEKGENAEGLMTTGAVGTGFMLVDAESVMKIADYYLTCKYEKDFLFSEHRIATDGCVEFLPYDEAKLPEFLKQNLARLEKARWDALLKEGHNAWWFECLKNPLGDGEWGEDISFCFKAHELGIPIWVDTSIRVGHLGTYSYSLDDYKDYQQGVIKEETHKQMLRAVVGMSCHPLQPKPQQAQQATKTISVIAPTRGRWAMMRQSINALFSKASHPTNIEVIIRYDEDDPLSDLWHHWEPMRVELFSGPREHYRGLHHYYNELAAKATGDWILCWSDDAMMETEGWDEKIHEHAGGLKVLRPFSASHPLLNLFPVLSRPFYEALGHVSLQTHGDSWLQVVARMNGIEEPLDVTVKHLREDIDDLTKKTSLGTYRESSPEFFSPEFQELLYADVMKIKAELAQ